MKKILFAFVFILVLLAGSYSYYSLSNSGANINPQILDFGKNEIPKENNFGKEYIVAKNLQIPWALDFLPNGNLIFTQREGQVFFVDKDFKNSPSKLADIPGVKAQGEGGLLGIAVHPDFENNNFVYTYYTYGNSGNNTMNRVSRFTYTDNALTGEKIIVDKIPGGSNHNGGRIKFGPDKMLYVGTGDAQEPTLSQNKNSMAGKILRVTEDGSPTSDNPFGNEVYSYGHRNVQGLTWDSQGNLWATEHGNSAKDELNKIQKGGNYGWPQITGDQTRNGIISPIINSGSSTWAPSGLASLDGSLYFTGLRGRDLFRFQPSSNSLTKLFDGKLGRIREAVMGPDGALYITTNNTDGRGTPQEEDDKLIRLEL